MKKRHCFIWWRQGLPCPITRKTESEDDVEDSPRAISKEAELRQSVQKPIQAVSPDIQAGASVGTITEVLGDAIGKPLDIPAEDTPADPPTIFAHLQNYMMAEPMPLRYDDRINDALEQFYGHDIGETWSTQERDQLSTQSKVWGKGSQSSSPETQILNDRLGAVNEFGLASNLMKGNLSEELGLSPWEALTMSELASSKAVGERLLNLEPSLNAFLNTMKTVNNTNITMGHISQILESLPPTNAIPLWARLSDYLMELQENPKAVEFFKTQETSVQPAGGKQPMRPGQKPIPQKRIPGLPVKKKWQPKFVPRRPPMIMNPWEKVAMRNTYKQEIGKMIGRGRTNRLFITPEEKKKRKKYGAQTRADAWWRHEYTTDQGPTGTYGAGDWFSSLHS